MQNPYTALLTRLREMQSAPYYATARGSLADAEHVIIDLESGLDLAIQHRDELLAALVDTLDFVERHSNRWDGENGKHPFVVVEAARLAIANAKPA